MNQSTQETRIAYRVGWLIDGSGDRAAKDQMIVAEGSQILQVGHVDQVRQDVDRCVDLTGYTVFPGLVDSHVHLVMSGTTDAPSRQGQLTNGYAQRRPVIANHLAQHLACGVLAVRDGGDEYGHVLQYKHDPDNQPLLPVAIAAAGRARRAAGRYGKLIGLAVEEGASLTESAFGAASLRDHLKLVNSGLNSLTEFGVASPPQFDREALQEVVAAARCLGIPTMVHANGVEPVKLAVQAGCDSIEHGFFMGRENMQRMVDGQVTWVPTAVTMKAYSDYLEKQGHRSDTSFADVSRRNLDHQLEQISMARQLGVTLALGTDAGSPGVHHGLAVKTELELFVEAGFSVETALRCASHNGARLMGLDDRGMIASGMRADFMAVAGSPQKLPQRLDQIICRVVAGREIILADAADSNDDGPTA